MVPIENNLADANKQFATEMRNRLIDGYINPIVIQLNSV